MKKFNEGPELSSGDIDELVDSFNETSDKKVEEGEEGLYSFHELTKDEGLTGIGEGEEEKKEQEEINKGVNELEEDVRAKAEKMLEKAATSPSSKENVGKVDTELNEKNEGEEIELDDEDIMYVDDDLPEESKEGKASSGLEEIKDDTEDDGPSLDELIEMAENKSGPSESAEVVELDSDVLEEIPTQEEVQSKKIESPISALGEQIESFENDTFVAESHLGSMYDKEDKDRENFEQIEDTVAINPKENLVALGDGMGGVGSGDKAAKDFTNLFEKVSFGDLSNLSNEEIEDLFIDKLNGMANQIDEGMITCSMVKLLKDKEGNQKVVAFNVGDSGLYYKNNEGNVSELIEAASPWEEITEEYGNILDNPDDWARFLNGMRRNKEISDYFKKISQDPEMQTLRDKFDFHKVMQYVENDNELDDGSKKKIFKLFKNINRQSPTAFNMPDKETGGIKPLDKANIKIIDVQPGDVILGCSDGVGDNLDNNQIAQLMNGDFTKKAGRDNIRDSVNKNVKKKAYFKPDDFSYIIIQVKA